MSARIPYEVTVWVRSLDSVVVYAVTREEAMEEARQMEFADSVDRAEPQE